MEILLQTQVDIGVARTTNGALGWAVAELSNWRLEVNTRRRIEVLVSDVGVGLRIKSVPTPECPTCASTAIRAQPARTRASLVVAEIVEGEWEPSVQRDDRADRPVPDHRIRNGVHTASKPFTLAERQIVNGIGADYVFRIEVTRRSRRRLFMGFDNEFAGVVSVEPQVP